jgi:predicted actin-binding protein
MRTKLLPALLASLVAGLLLATGALAAAPGNTTAPAVTGTAKVGSTLTVSNGSWSGSPTSYTYQWQRCTSTTSCTDITGATQQTYVVRNADAGKTLRAVVTASNADGSSTANSNMTTTVASSGGPVNTVRPSISGDAVVGSTLTADTGTWSGSPTSYSYQWLQCDQFGSGCVPVTGATGKTYGVRMADVDGTLRVDVTAKNANGSTTRRSTTSDIVEPLPIVTTPGNKAPTIVFLSLKRLGSRVYARFRVCDDAAKGVTVYERDVKAGALAYVRKFSVVPNRCAVATRSWFPAPRFRTKGRFTVTLRAVDKSRASSRFVSHSLVNR